MEQGIIVGLFWFLVFIIGHLLAFIKNPHTHRAKIILYALFFTSIGQIFTIGIMLNFNFWLINGAVLGKYLVTVICSLLFFNGLFILYMPLYYTVAKSLSIESLMLISNNRSSCKLEYLYNNFVSDDLISERLDTMVKSGYLYYYNEKYFLTKKGLFLAKTFSIIKRFWKLGSGG